MGQRLAALVRDGYSVAALDPGVTEPTFIEMANGFRALALPRDQQPEPVRSFRLIDAGGPRDNWAGRSTMISTGLSVVVPWTAR